MLTNGLGRVQRRKLAAHGLGEFFDAVVVSHEIGALKPDPSIFAAVTERLPADSHVYVADSVTDDIEPANEAGFRTVHVAERHGNCPADAAVAPTEFETLVGVFQ